MDKIVGITLLLAMISYGCDEENIAKDGKFPPGRRLDRDSKFQNVFVLDGEVPHGLAFGRGLNSLLGPNFSLDHSVCVKAETPSFPMNGANTVLRVESIKDSSDYQKKTNVNFTLTIGANATGGQAAAATQSLASASISATVKNIGEISIKRDHSYILVIAEKRFLPMSVSNYSLLPEALKLLQQDPAKFFWKCGDQFISSFVPGIRAYAVIECLNTSRTERNAIDASIAANASYAGVSSGASFQKSVDTILSNTNAKCQIYIQTEGGTGSISTDPSTFAASAAAYVQNSTAESAVPIEVGGEPYTNLLTQQPGFEQVVEKANFNLSHQKQILAMNQVAVDELLNRIDIYNAGIAASTDPQQKRNFVDKRDAAVQNVLKFAVDSFACAREPFSKCSSQIGDDVPLQ